MAYRRIKAAGKMAGALLRGRLSYLILHVTSACNARCRMCFNWDGMHERGSRGPALEDLARLAESVNPLPQLTCSGGEPLLRSDLPDILAAFYGNGSTRFFTVPTNSLSPKRAEKLIARFVSECPEGFLNFCLPFHGVGEQFENILGVPGSLEKFNATWGIIQEARKQHANISCNLNFVMSKFNYENYREILDHAFESYPEAPIGIAYARGIPQERDAVEVPLEIYRKAQAYRAEKLKTAAFNPFTLMHAGVGKQMTEMVSRVTDETLKDLKCRAGRHFLVIYEDGMVYPCELIDVVGLPDADNPEAPEKTALGNLNEYRYDMRALLASDHAKALLAWIDSHECACTWECAVYSRIIHSPAGLLRAAADGVTCFLRAPHE